LKINGTQNPNLLSANVSPLSWQIFTSEGNLFPIDGIVENLKPSPDLQGVTITILAHQFSSLEVNS